MAPRDVGWKHLGILATVIAVAISAVSFYVQLQEWKTLGPEHDHMLLVANVAITLLLWGLLITGIVTFWRGAPAGALSAPKVDLVETLVTYDAAAQYKLKIIPLLRNRTGDCVDVKMLKFSPDTIKLIGFPRETLQVRNARRGWEPANCDSEVHVLDGEAFKAWVAPEAHYSKADIERALGRIGCLVLLVNGAEVSIRL